MSMLLLALIAALQPLQATAPDTTAAGRRATATRVQDRPRIDGLLDDPVWRDAVWIGGFTQREPTEGAPAEAPTEVAFAYDDDALYVAARMRAVAGTPVQASVTRRDREEGSAEQIAVSFDTQHDRLTAYTFAVTPSGVRIDYFHPSDFETSRDYSWDPVWEAETTVAGDGWTAEMRIPFTQLRFRAGEQQVWGVNVVRQIPARNASEYWILVGRDETGWASRMGELTGLRQVRPARGIELLPYVASEARLTDAVDPLDPFASETETGVRVGGDVKVGLGPNMTLDITLNPDFGQVEADPAVVNLTAYEVFFPERRPFFTAGTQHFGYRGMFYTRRIGAPPVLSPGGDYNERVDNTTVLGAAKLTGRLPSRTSIGVLTAVTGREVAGTYDTASASFGTLAVAPRTFYGVAALRREFGHNTSTLGGQVTAVERQLDESGPLADALTRRAYSGIIDGRLRWADGGYDVSAYYGVTWVEGSPGTLLGLQRSSRRYYQRPDADYVDVDPARTSLSGYMAGINHSKLAGSWRWDVDYTEESPGLEPNDIGQLSSSDDRGLFGHLQYRDTEPGRVLRYWEVGTYDEAIWNYGGVRTHALTGGYVGGRFANFWRFDAAADYRFEALNDALTRGGPLMRNTGNLSATAGLGSAPSSRTRWSARVTVDRDALDGWFTELEGGLSFRPGARWELSLDPEYNFGDGSLQYIATLGGGGPATYGSRYVFSRVETSEIALRIRLNYALTPDLTLETYAEPFASSARFHDFGELERASGGLRRYGSQERQPDGSWLITDGAGSFTLSDEDFRVTSFRSNVVLRWEWRPGSTAYLVWQQDRSAGVARFERVGPGGLWDALTTSGDNFLALKVSYWLPIR